MRPMSAGFCGCTLLAPEIVEAILDGRQPAELQLDAQPAGCWTTDMPHREGGRDEDFRSRRRPDISRVFGGEPPIACWAIWSPASTTSTRRHGLLRPTGAESGAEI